MPSIEYIFKDASWVQIKRKTSNYTILRFFLCELSMESKFGTQFIFLQMNTFGFMSLILMVHIILVWAIKQKRNIMDTALFIEKFERKNLRINVFNIHFWQPVFEFGLSGQHLGLIRSFQIMVHSVLNQFPRRDLGITFPQVFSIKDASSSLPTSPTSAHKKWIMEHTCVDLRLISAFCRCKCKF